jgi:hypothetical protein
MDWGMICYFPGVSLARRWLVLELALNKEELLALSNGSTQLECWFQCAVRRVVKILRFGLRGIKICCTFCCASIVVLCCVVWFFSCFVDFDLFVIAIDMYNVIVVIYCILVWLELLAQVWTHYETAKLNMWTLFCNVRIEFLNSPMWEEIMLESNGKPSSVTTFSTDFSFQKTWFFEIYLNFMEYIWFSISPIFWIQILWNKFH